MALVATAVATYFGAYATPANAAEGATGFYLLGSKTSMTGFLPPPGTYVQDLNYFYSGHADGKLDFAGLTVSAGVNADAYYNLPIGLWVAPGKVLDGDVALTVMAPIGWKKLEGDAGFLTVTMPLAVGGR